MPTVLITGANRGIGLELARQYRKDGWRVIATVREKGKAGDLEKTGAEIHMLDVTDGAAVARLGKRLDDEIIDVAIANAGVAGSKELTDTEGWMKTFAVNTIAPLVVANAVRPAVAKSHQKKIVAITSVLGSIERNTEGGMYAYRSSKAALNAAFRSFAADHKDVIATVLHPGWVRTDMGGQNATLSPQESVAGLRKVIDGLTPKDSGRFYAYDGSEIPW
jgi:NAD(P)-dependent dehydrogenase (short-subunit alcohol dehydrogenase family)